MIYVCVYVSHVTRRGGCERLALGVGHELNCLILMWIWIVLVSLFILFEFVFSNEFNTINHLIYTFCFRSHRSFLTGADPNNANDNLPEFFSFRSIQYANCQLNWFWIVFCFKGSDRCCFDQKQNVITLMDKKVAHIVQTLIVYPIFFLFIIFTSFIRIYVIYSIVWIVFSLFFSFIFHLQITKQTNKTAAT